MSKKPSKSVRKPNAPKAKAKAGLLGIGFDNDDGHKRITMGDQFALVGGSQETHERMTETVVKTFEELKRRDRSLETVDPEELGEIVQKSAPH